MREVTKEGREALRGLRTTDSSVSLEDAFERMLSETVSSPSSETVVHVQGPSRQMKTAVFEEVYRIGREAYLNSVAHARAKRIDIAVDYGLREFRLFVRDNGRGFDAEVLRNGRDGHWGLAGMRERAEAIGSILTIRTDTPGGTNVELRVPAAIAYSTSSVRRFKRPWRTLTHCSEPQKETQQ
jgi:signal transduction histidine kinase